MNYFRGDGTSRMFVTWTHELVRDIYKDIYYQVTVFKTYTI